MPAPVRFRVVPEEEGMMLARLLVRRLPELGLDGGKRLIKAGAVYLGHLRVRIPSTRVATGERVTVYRDALTHVELPTEQLHIMYRDDDCVVVDKPAGVPVAATRMTARGTLSEALRRQLEREGVPRPYVGVVHRLDQGATGLVLFTTRAAANRSVHHQFELHRIERSYRVLVHGDTPAAFVCEAPLVQAPGGRGMRIATPGEARALSASTRFERLEPESPRTGTSLLAVRLVTGRTHQIRVHAASLGHPVVGDGRYGTPVAGEPLHLHAYALAFEHPHDGRLVRVSSPLPAWARSTGDPV